MIDLHLEVADPTLYGWKAHYLSRVAKTGLAVPHAVALSPNDSIDLRGVVDARKSYAVRSSGLGEDGVSQSYAGYFRTHLEVRGAEKVRDAIAEVRASASNEMPMAVVVQDMVKSPAISGVAFSVNPVTFETSATTITWVHGLGDDLVSGTVSGDELQVDLKDAAVMAGDWPHSLALLNQLVDAVIQLRDLLGRPVDIEWAVSAAGELVILQLRPIVLPSGGVIDLDSAAAFAGLPGCVRAHSKLGLRAVAATANVPMSPARAILANAVAGAPEVPPLAPSAWSAGRSVVLLHPTHVEGRIVREFTKDCGTDVEFFVRECQRYAIRQYPEQSGAVQAVVETLDRGLENAAFACVVEQEILHAYATGILRRTGEGYLIDIALGHFVPKGYVETTTFALSTRLEPVSQVQTTQTKAYHFINGHVVVETPPYEDLELSCDDLAMVVNTLQPILLVHPDAAVEFGVIGHPGKLSAYLIDIADSDNEEAAPSAADLARGIVSSGFAEGPIVDLRDSTTSDDLNAHLHDTVRAGEHAGLAPAIYLAKAASVDLLPIVRAAHPASGFLFERASILAHLPVVLRERGIAAMKLPIEEISNIVEGGMPVRINTMNVPAVMPLPDGVLR